MSGQIIPLKPNQVAVTRLPRLMTELPFFYLTKKANALTEPIDFRTEDNDGRPIVWKVNPNFSEAIGPPSLMAHEVWVRLIKPRIDEERKSLGFIPSLIPLGGVRQCLRYLGWSYGGHQAHSLIRAINQIGGAWCEANLWLPIREMNENGSATFRAFHANFSRLSLYAIGANHLTEEDISQGRIDFSFELDDILYIKLDPIEMRMLEAETDRPIDNEYLFSLSPSGRRWYELMAPKFFGVISNAQRGKGYCEIRYSWYVRRHHTLKPHLTRKRRVQQMNEVISEHLRLGFIHRVEYETVKGMRGGNSAEEIIIRYYPGKFALKITRRISESLRPREQARKVSGLVKIEIQDHRESKETNCLEDELISLGVARVKARYLVKKNKAAVERQLLALPFREKRGIRDLAAWLVSAVEDDFGLPDSTARTIEGERLRLQSKEEAQSNQAREEHENRFRVDYSQYLQIRAEDIQRKNPDLYLLFLEATLEERNENDRFLDSPELRKVLFEKLFHEFFKDHPESPVLSFWEWDTKLNSLPFSPH